MLTHFSFHSRFLKESLRVLICLSLFNFQGSSLFLSGITCSYEGFDYEQFYLAVIIFSLLCPFSTAQLSSPSFWAPDYITTSKYRCQHFFVVFCKFFETLCQGSISLHHIPLNYRYMVQNSRSPKGNKNHYNTNTHHA